MHIATPDQPDLDQLWVDLITVEAAARTRVHDDHASRRALSEGYDLVGLMGEAQFAREFRQPLNLLAHAGGDDGYDFALPLRFTVDVKTARKAYYLIQEQGRVTADIYVLAEYSDEPVGARLVGWQYGHVLRKQPIRDFGAGIDTHYIPAACLRPMQELLDRVMRLA